jgi:hypothetical protein
VPREVLVNPSKAGASVVAVAGGAAVDASVGAGGVRYRVIVSLRGDVVPDEVAQDCIRQVQGTGRRWGVVNSDLWRWLNYDIKWWNQFNINWVDHWTEVR